MHKSFGARIHKLREEEKKSEDLERDIKKQRRVYLIGFFIECARRKRKSDENEKWNDEIKKERRRKVLVFILKKKNSQKMQEEYNYVDKDKKCIQKS